MGIVIGFITFVLVLNCLFLMLLILIQLPKKEAGAGIAFGGGAADALFGAGSGNALTKVTKYSAGTFLGIALLLSFLNSYTYGATQRARRLEQRVIDAAAAAAASAPASAGTPTSPALTTNVVQGPIVPAAETNGGFQAVPIPPSPNP